MKTKALRGVKIVDEEQGYVEAVFATKGVVDSDGDVTLDGAFDDGAEARISAYNHASWGPGQPPVGKGTIHEIGDQAIFKGQFFMDTQPGRETFAVVKHLGPLGEWSYGYDVEDSEKGQKDGKQVNLLKKLKVHEVSPVILGAGVDTRTLITKMRNAADELEQIEDEEGDDTGKLAGGVESKAALPAHSSKTVAGSWDGPAAVRNCPAERGALRAIHAWVDPNGDPSSKGSYKFPHHASPDGPANLTACSATIAVLNGGRGGSAIPDSDRSGVYNHVARHIRDGGKEPPELSSGEPGTTKLNDQLAWVTAEVEVVRQRLAEVLTMRAENGNKLSDDVRASTKALVVELERLREVLTIEPHVNPEWAKAQRLIAQSRTIVGGPLL